VYIVHRMYTVTEKVRQAWQTSFLWPVLALLIKSVHHSNGAID